MSPLPDYRLSQPVAHHTVTFGDIKDSPQCVTITSCVEPEAEACRLPVVVVICFSAVDAATCRLLGCVADMRRDVT